MTWDEFEDAFRKLLDDARTSGVTYSPSLSDRLHRYSKKCISDKLDPDFAEAVEELEKTLKKCRHELCMKCEGYKERYLSPCKDCKWKEVV